MKNMTKTNGNLMGQLQIEQTIISSWQLLSHILSPARSDSDYKRQVALLDTLIDEVGEQENHPLNGFMEILGVLVEQYELEHDPLPEASGREVLAFLMEEHNLKQSELPELGSQGVVSEILNGKRQLNVRQIQALSQRFQVNPAVFI